MNFDPHPFAARRSRLAGLMREAGGGVAIVPTAPERIRNADNEYPYRFDSSFYYLSGFREPDAVLVLIAGEVPRSLLFCREKHPEREIWDGFRWGPEAARAEFGFDAAYPIDQLDSLLPELLADQPAVFHALGAHPNDDSRVLRALEKVRAEARSGVSAPQAVQDIRLLLDEMRLFKDAHEVELLRNSGRIASAAHERAMRFVRPGHFEYQVEAELLHEFMSRGAQAPAYSSIVAGGANACVLHYMENRAQLKDGDLLLIDAGCELDGYASDITRSVPVNGRFSAAQQAVYEIVLAAQNAAFGQVRPGARYSAYHEAAVAVLVAGLIELGLLKGEQAELIETNAYNRFYMHRTGHWLGLDVHDAGRYKIAGDWRSLAPGQVLTVEPGLYIRPAADIPEAFWNIGIRIEDDLLVTAEGYENLSAAAPKTVAEIHRVMRG